MRFLFVHLTRRRKLTRDETVLREIEKTADDVQRRLEKMSGENNSGAEFYRFKEVSARYAGLSLAVLNDQADSVDPVKSLLQFSEAGSRELGSICLRRRNRQRLVHHQTSAGEDFAAAVAEIRLKTDDQKSFKNLALELSEILRDRLTNEKLKRYFRFSPPSAAEPEVGYSEQILWKTRPSKIISPESISINLTALKRTEQSYKD